MSSNAERQAAYRARRLAEGMVQVQVYVPPTARREIRAAASRLRAAHLAKSPRN